MAVEIRAFDYETLAWHRRTRGLRQEDLARRVGRARVTISDIERGRLRPSADLGRALAEAVAGAFERLGLMEFGAGQGDCVAVLLTPRVES